MEVYLFDVFQALLLRLAALVVTSASLALASRRGGATAIIRGGGIRVDRELALSTHNRRVSQVGCQGRVSTIREKGDSGRKDKGDSKKLHCELIRKIEAMNKITEGKIMTALSALFCSVCEIVLFISFLVWIDYITSKYDEGTQ
uniref:Uncharacterized protein n=1 Tax=Attheya septentrionalis TaxID=420275 RepID=A0A7S2U954_9STRA|mmetsp:Transcript_14033/g.25367  ORF Transcript_14033/g.25367 Transcript_14033/m.25367 type:complete len:144 (+) Transcript_14033:243-674(+)